MTYILIIILLFLIILAFDKRAVPIFLYHQVNPLSNVFPELLEEHLKIIKKYKMNTITLTEYYTNKVEKNSILLTFDDGYYDNFKYVFPLLKRYHVKATIFLNTLYIEEQRIACPLIRDNNTVNLEAMKKYLETGSATINQYMSWEEIKEMYESGLVDFQAHSHKHMAMFTDTKIKGLTKKENMEAPDLYLYGEIEDNYPIFSKRGEYTGRAVLIKKEFFNNFKEHYEKNVKDKFASQEEVLKACQSFIDESKEYFLRENQVEYEQRIREDYLTNKDLIEKHLGNRVKFFCWPWGHKSEEAVKFLKTLGVAGFVTTKKGTNSRYPDWNKIKRIELRKYTKKKFLLNMLVARNSILGKIYGWLS